MAQITSLSQLDLNGYYTYQDYLTWRLKERVELIRGLIFKMSPAPNVRHQSISWNISILIGQALKEKQCRAFSAPFDVRLPVSKKKGQTDTVVQPDIVVICDITKLDEQGCNGAPDIVIEILSPGNSSREMKDKFDLYEASLVPEYWIVDPDRQDIMIYSLNDQNRYIGSRPYMSGDHMSSSVLDGLAIDVAEVFVGTHPFPSLGKGG